MSSYRIRSLSADDNEAMAALIRTVLGEFDADRPGFASSDPEMADLYRAYDRPSHAYWVAVDDSGEVVGGVGIAPLEPAINGVSELRKMYLHPKARGQGVGRALLTKALAYAEHHYRWCYLETLVRMDRAQALYRQAGFMSLPSPLVDTGHHGCDRWMLLEFSADHRFSGSDDTIGG
ncbi:GNAT family N-acetyltransferase [Reinekea blandensis]|uniref:Predicted acetyltransferase n=1 Tax=Reinekea blandensis MED297 TaxID=314283 RepID=A4BD78_9GAMM|nr:GNAT family N-acetyltransferase [Reinekea blandensis]EAR09822.1 Predicted acetyltransferase [Reinekea sp. MED297] [Reinekea blandensis MED297]